MASDWFSKIGSTVRQAASQGADVARKTVGIGVGEIAIKLDQSHYRAGDTVSGTVHLEIPEAVEAKALVVKLVATGVRTTSSVGTKGASVNQERETLFSFTQELDGNKTYEVGNKDYDFSIAIPKDVERDVKIPDAGGVVSEVARVVSAFANAGKRPTRWKLTAALDIPWHKNISKTVDVSVVQE